MNKTELIKQLRALTQAGMKDCKDALEESNFDLQKAIDIVKVKGLNIVSGREGKVASEGMVAISRRGPKLASMIEVNCQTDFVAKENNFQQFVNHCASLLVDAVYSSQHFAADSVEKGREELVALTKENIVVRRWWAEETIDPRARVFTYVHSNNKIGVLLTMLAPSVLAASDPAFIALGEDLAMQIAAMNPISVSSAALSSDEINRQKSIFEEQLTQLNKPKAAWTKILEGKFNKWYTEVCLLNQESLMVPKSTVQKVIEDVGQTLGGEIKVSNFTRCQVGEGIEKSTTDLADEVAKMVSMNEEK